MTQTTGTITVTADHFDRPIVVIPDADARRLANEIHDGWTEILGMADGYSRPFEPGSWGYDMTRDILAALTEAGADRIAFVVGESGWDADTSWWRDYASTRDLHPSGFPSRRYDRDAYEWTG